MEKAYGPESIYVAGCLGEMGNTYLDAGRPADALPAFRRALALRTKLLGPSHAKTLYDGVRVAGALVDLHRCDEARPLLATGIASLGAPDTDEELLADALQVSAECDLAGGDGGAAQAKLERAVTIDLRTKSRPVGLGKARWGLARALWLTGKRDEAIAAARAAEIDLAATAEGVRDRAAARAWLTARSR